MLQYSNSITCSSNEQANEIVIHFRQNSPILSEDGQISSIECITLSEIVLTKESVNALIKILSDIISPTLEE